MTDFSVGLRERMRDAIDPCNIPLPESPIRSHIVKTVPFLPVGYETPRKRASPAVMEHLTSGFSRVTVTPTLTEEAQHTQVQTPVAKAPKPGKRAVTKQILDEAKGDKEQEEPKKGYFTRSKARKLEQAAGRA